jgi:transcriptional regulator with XRE-family HTH domain
MLSAIELEKCNVTVQQVVALADFFGVSTDYLIRGKQ